MSKRRAGSSPAWGTTFSGIAESLYEYRNIHPAWYNYFVFFHDMADRKMFTEQPDSKKDDKNYPPVRSLCIVRDIDWLKLRGKQSDDH